MYPYFNVFVRLLDSDNNCLKWGAIMTVANLTAVDVEGRFEAIFDKYYAPIKGPTMVTAANIIGSSARIARAKPRLTGPITHEILKVDRANYERHGAPSPECRNVAIGHAIDSFDQFFDQVEDQAAVLRFVKRQLKNTRKQVVKKAEQFLRRQGTTRTRRGQALDLARYKRGETPTPNPIRSAGMSECDALVFTKFQVLPARAAQMPGRCGPGFVKSLSGGNALRFAHPGPYTNLRMTYGQITEFLKVKG